MDLIVAFSTQQGCINQITFTQQFWRQFDQETIRIADIEDHIDRPVGARKFTIKIIVNGTHHVNITCGIHTNAGTGFNPAASPQKRPINQIGNPLTIELHFDDESILAHTRGDIAVGCIKSTRCCRKITGLGATRDENKLTSHGNIISNIFTPKRLVWGNDEP